MSIDGQNVLVFMLRNLTTMKYAYRCIVEGCFDNALNHGHKVPPESKDEIVDEAIKLLNEVEI